MGKFAAVATVGFVTEEGVCGACGIALREGDVVMIPPEKTAAVCPTCGVALVAMELDRARTAGIRGSAFARLFVCLRVFAQAAERTAPPSTSSAEVN